MFAEIILSQRFPKHLGIFDYKIPDELASEIKLGQLVTIPFRKSECEGVIVTTKKTSAFEKNIKPITKINQPDPILTTEQITLARWMSEYYFVSLGTIIKMMLPPIPKTKRILKKSNAVPPMTAPALPMELNGLLSTFMRNKKNPAVFWPSTYQQHTQFMYWLLKKIKGKVLIIVPELADIDTYRSLLPAKKQSTVAIVHSQLNKTQFFDAWQRIISGQAKIVIGTKLALFAPLKKPELIILDQEENQGHKQADQNPRFDGRAVASRLAELHGCRLLFTSHAPSVEAYNLIENKTYALLKPTNTPPAIRIIDLKNERAKKNFSLFSDDLQDAITTALQTQQKIFLFLNKKGAATSVMCKDCGLVITCNQCSRPLVYHQTNNSLYCHYCNTRNEVPPFCPKCSSVDFKFIGAGTQTVEQQAKKLWPHATIVRLDTDTQTKQLPKQCNIIIGTEFAFDILDWQSINLVGVISADTFMHLPDFRAAERTWQMLTNITYHYQGNILLQTYTPDGYPIKYFPAQPEQFYQQELQDRQSISYPPFMSLVKLIYQHSDKHICLANTKKYLAVLKTSPLQSMILTPLAPRLNNKYRMYLVIKFKSPDQDAVLKKILSTIPEGWIIDRDPVNLL